jgi:hypothetical protein
MYRYQKFSALSDCPHPEKIRGQLPLPGYVNIYGALLVDIFHSMTLIHIRHKKFFLQYERIAITFYIHILLWMHYKEAERCQEVPKTIEVFRGR